MKESNPIRLVSGALFDPFDPDVSVITLDDISAGLAHSNRYAGQTLEAYCTAEHACHVFFAVRGAGGNLATQWKALHHDDSDAFLWDIPRPMKSHPGLAWLVERERFLQAELYKLFRCDSFGPVDENLIHRCDAEDKIPEMAWTVYDAFTTWRRLVFDTGAIIGFDVCTALPGTGFVGDLTN